MSRLGIYASQISGHLSPPAVGFVSIATTTVGSGGSSSITFSAIPQTFTHLQIRYIAQAGSGNTTDSVRVQFNGDTGSNYAYQVIYGTGSSAATTNNNGNSFAKAGQLALSTTAFSDGIIDILDYKNTNKLKTLRSLSGVDFNGSGGVIALESNLWNSTASITSITISYGVNYSQYSSFALYGIQGA